MGIFTRNPNDSTHYCEKALARHPYKTLSRLLGVQSSYVLAARWTDRRPMFLEGFDGFVASTVAPMATGWNDPVARRELHALKIHALPRHTHGHG